MDIEAEYFDPPLFYGFNSMSEISCVYNDLLAFSIMENLRDFHTYLALFLGWSLKNRKP